MLNFKITNLDSTIKSLEALTQQGKSAHEAAVKAGLLFLIEKAQATMGTDHSEELHNSFLIDLSNEANSIVGTLTNTSEHAAVAEWGAGEGVPAAHFMQRAFTENRDELRQVMLAAVKAGMVK